MNPFANRHIWSTCQYWNVPKNPPRENDAIIFAIHHLIRLYEVLLPIQRHSPSLFFGYLYGKSRHFLISRYKHHMLLSDKFLLIPFRPRFHANILANGSAADGFEFVHPDCVFRRLFFAHKFDNVTWVSWSALPMPSWKLQKFRSKYVNFGFLIAHTSALEMTQLSNVLIADNLFCIVIGDQNIR